MRTAAVTPAPAIQRRQDFTGQRGGVGGLRHLSQNVAPRLRPHNQQTLFGKFNARRDGAPQSFDVQPLRETARIARAVRERLFL